MLQISSRKIDERFELLPERLKEVILSPANSEVLWRIGESNHLDNQKISKIGVIAARVILGFIHVEDLAKEVRSELNIAPEIANSIAAEIDKKIFAPIRADLEKVYMPPVAEAPQPTPQAEPETAPKEALDLRISKTTPTASEEIKIVGAGMPTPKMAAEEKLAPAEAPPAPPKLEEGPLIIHKEVGIKPAPIEGGTRSLGGLFGFLKPTRKKEDRDGVVAQISLGKEPEKPTTIISKPEPIKPRIVHYTEFRTPISPFGEGQGEMSKTELSKQPPPPAETKEAGGPRESVPESPKILPTREASTNILKNEIFERPEIESPVSKQPEISPIIELKKTPPVPKFSPTEAPPSTMRQAPEATKPQTEENNNAVVDLRTFEIKKSQNN